MRARRSGRQHGAIRWGIGLLIASLIHTPLPEPDYHNIRHHDAPGEVCEHHDHLLRWHPGAGTAQDVAVLHWHWFLPAAQPGEPATASDRPAFHAHVADWVATSWANGPGLTVDRASRLTPRPAPCPVAFTAADVRQASSDVALPSRGSSVHAFCATFAPGTSLSTLLVRWVC
jgi:hypothetical protein